MIQKLRNTCRNWCSRSLRIKVLPAENCSNVFLEIRNQLWKGELWNHSYYVETIGSVSEENIRRYMEHQSKSY